VVGVIGALGVVGVFGVVGAASGAHPTADRSVINAAIITENDPTLIDFTLVTSLILWKPATMVRHSSAQRLRASDYKERTLHSVALPRESLQNPSGGCRTELLPRIPGDLDAQYLADVGVYGARAVDSSAGVLRRQKCMILGCAAMASGLPFAGAA